MEALSVALSAHLFPDDEASRTYAVIDGASCEGLLSKIDECQPEHVCLYAGELEPDVEEVAPYLVRLEPEGAFTEWLLQEGWGKHWGIFLAAPVDLRSMRKHLRTLLLVRDADNKTLYFRYYDPRVIRTYLPTCTPDETRQIFGPCTSLWAEDEDPAKTLRWTYQDGTAERQVLTVKN